MSGQTPLIVIPHLCGATLLDSPKKWGAPDFIYTIHTIGQSMGLQSSLGDSMDTTKHLFGRVSIALWQGNANMWLHRQPILPPELDGQPLFHYLFLFCVVLFCLVLLSCLFACSMHVVCIIVF